jgi:uncharacterized membrane protein YoaK (UPF0700 family)
MPSSASEDRALTTILLGLTAVTGVVDAVSYLALGVFTANMTGNVVLLAFAVAGAPGLSVPRLTTSLAGFFFGAVLGGRIAAWMSPGPRHHWTGAAFGLEAALLLTALAVGAGHHSVRPVDSVHLYTVITLAALAMGLRSATVRKLAVLDLSTVVLTSMIIDLAIDLSSTGGRSPRWPARIAAVAAMFAGAAAGALLVRESLALPLAVSAVASGMCAAGAFLALRTEAAT